MNFELIDLSLQKEGYREFISTWICTYNNSIYLVDPGPTNSLHHIYKALGQRVPEYCLLTHIHVDHAGGTGELCRKFPNLKVFVSDNAVSHLIDPQKLIDGSRRTLGDEIMDLYGNILPVLKGNILTEVPNGIEVVKTPGHAPHHISYVMQDLVFCGEAIGVRYGEDYLRPATPVKFRYDIYTESIRQLSKCVTGTLCFGHFGFETLKRDSFERALLQIELWVEVVKEGLALEKTNDELILDLQVKDPLFSTYQQLPEDIQKREYSFVNNTLSGIREYILAIS